MYQACNFVVIISYDKKELQIDSGQFKGVLPLNMGTSRTERLGKQYINRKWIPTLLDKNKPYQILQNTECQQKPTYFMTIVSPYLMFLWF